MVVRSLFWMICKDLQIGNAFDGIGAKTLASRRHKPSDAHGSEIGQDLTPMYSTVVPVNEQMGKGLSQMGLARP